MFIKLLPGLFHVPYLTRLQTLKLKLKSLEKRRKINEKIFILNIIRNVIDIPFEKYFYFNTNNTRSYSIKLKDNNSRSEYRRIFLVLGVLMYGKIK